MILDSALDQEAYDVNRNRLGKISSRKALFSLPMQQKGGQWAYTRADLRRFGKVKGGVPSH